jgi:hypothetical protein
LFTGRAGRKKVEIKVEVEEIAGKPLSMRVSKVVAACSDDLKACYDDFTVSCDDGRGFL